MQQKYTFEQLITIAALERHAKEITGHTWIEILCDWIASGATEMTPEMKEVIGSVKSEAIEFIEDKLAPAELEVIQ